MLLVVYPQTASWYGELHISEDAEVRMTDGRVLRGEDAARVIILGHELTHRLEQLAPTEYAEVEKLALRARADEIGVKAYREAAGYSERIAKGEITANYAMRTLFTDEKTIREVTKQHSRLAQAIRGILQWIREKIGRSSEIDRAIYLWNKAYNQASRNAKNTDVHSMIAKENTADGGVKWSDTVSDFVDKAILNKGKTEEKYNQKRIGAVNSLGIQMVAAASGGKTDLTNKFFAMEGSKIFHEYERHKDATIEQSRGQIALTEQDIKDAIEILLNPEIVESIYTDGNNKSQCHSFALARHDAGGYHVLVIETVGGKRNPNIVPAMILKITDDKWNRYINSGKSIAEMIFENDPEALAGVHSNADNIKNRVTVAQFAANTATANTPRSPRFNNSVTQKVSIVNTQYTQNPKKNAKGSTPKSTSATDGLGAALEEIAKEEEREVKSVARELVRREQGAKADGRRYTMSLDTFEQVANSYAADIADESARKKFVKKLFDATVPLAAAHRSHGDAKAAFYDKAWRGMKSAARVLEADEAAVGDLAEEMLTILLESGYEGAASSRTAHEMFMSTRQAEVRRFI